MSKEEDRRKRRSARQRNLAAKNTPKFNKFMKHGRKIDYDRQKYKNIDLEDW